jgi:hypothetical protein
MLGKWVNERLIEPSANERKKIVITNPTDDILKYVMKYKDLTIAPEPEYDMETQYIVMVRKDETETELFLDWAVKDIENEELEQSIIEE